jgi:hypothetical protein
VKYLDMYAEARACCTPHWGMDSISGVLSFTRYYLKVRDIWALRSPTDLITRLMMDYI